MGLIAAVLTCNNKKSAGVANVDYSGVLVMTMCQWTVTHNARQLQKFWGVKYQNVIKNLFHTRLWDYLKTTPTHDWLRHVIINLTVCEVVKKKKQYEKK